MARTETDRHQYGFDLDHAAVFGCSHRIEAKWRVRDQGLAQKYAEPSATLAVPMRHEVSAAKLGPVALAKRSAGKAVNKASVGAGIKKEDKGQKAFQRLRIDIGLIRRRAALPKATPISDGKMTISVLHGSNAPTLLLSFACLTLTHCGRLWPAFVQSRAKDMPSRKIAALRRASLPIFHVIILILKSFIMYAHKGINVCLKAR